MGAWSDYLAAYRTSLGDNKVPDVGGTLIDPLDADYAITAGHRIMGGSFPLPDESTLADMPLEIMSLHMEINIVDVDKKYKLTTIPSQVVSTIPSYTLSDYWTEISTEGTAGPQGGIGPQGESITGIVDNGNGTLTISFTTLPDFTTPDLRGAPGQDGQDLTVGKFTKAIQGGTSVFQPTTGRYVPLDLGSDYTSKKLIVTAYADVGPDGTNYVTLTLNNSSTSDKGSGTLLLQRNLHSEVTLVAQRQMIFVGTVAARYLILELSGPPDVAYFGITAIETE